MGMELYDSGSPPTSSKALPSLSALTGMVRESTANSLIEKNYWDMQKTSARSLMPGTPQSPTPSSRPDGTQVGSLTSAAGRHLGKLQRAPASPYHRIPTAEDHKEMRAKVVTHLKEMAHSFRADQLVAAAAANGTSAPAPPGFDLSAVTGPTTPPMSPTGRAPPMSPTGRSHLQAGGPLLERRPSTGLTVSELQLPRPGTVSRRLSTPLSQSWSGGNDTWPGAGMPQSPTRATTPSRLASASVGLLLRQSGSVPLTPSKLADVWRNPAAGDPAYGADVAGRSPTDPSRLAPWSPSSNTTSQLSPRSQMRRAIGTTAANVSGALEDFQPTRGMMYSVFSELDAGDSGKMTYSSFEEAAFRIGMRADHARRFFDQLDTSKRGYIGVGEWGAPGKALQVLNFTRLFVRQTRGASGKPKDGKEIGSLSMAIDMAMHRLKLKNSGRSISSQRIADAFRFIDTDASGSLDRMEIADAFSALGIAVSPVVVDSAMLAFDHDNDGTIDYSEFLGTLFPTLSKGAYNMQG